MKETAGNKPKVTPVQKDRLKPLEGDLADAFRRHGFTLETMDGQMCVVDRQAHKIPGWPATTEGRFRCAFQCQQLPLPEFTYWQEHPRALLSEWHLEVANGDTRLGYWAWVRKVLDMKPAAQVACSLCEQYPDADEIEANSTNCPKCGRKVVAPNLAPNLFGTFDKEIIQNISLAVKQWLDDHGPNTPLDCSKTPQYLQMEQLLYQARNEYKRRNS